MFSSSSAAQKAQQPSSQTRPLEALMFDVSGFVNQLFPNEQSLSDVDAILSKLRSRIRLLDDKIQENLRLQTEHGDNSAAELESVTHAMQGLCGSIVGIKEKSRIAESVVVDITREIKTLDHAKRNLTSSITLLRRLSMLNSAVEQLKGYAAANHYDKVAQLLKVITELELHFRSFRNVPRIANVLNSLHAIQANIRSKIFELFDRSFNSLAVLQPSCDFECLRQACRVLENMDPSDRQQLEDWYCNLVLKEYRTIFNVKEELASLSNVHRRFAWLRRYIKMYDEDHCRVFPQQWRVDLIVCRRFGDNTRNGIIEVLCDMRQKFLAPVPNDSQIREPESESKILAKTMKTVLDFESAVSARYPDLPPYSAISAALEEQMMGTVEAEELRISEFLARTKTSPLKNDQGNPSVLASSTEMFLMYREILTNMSRLGKGALIVSICKIFAKYLTAYAEFLDDQTKDDRRPLSSIEEWELGCVIVNTCNYCNSIIGQLQEKIVEKALPDYHKDIVLDTQLNAFKTSTMKAVRFLVRSVDGRCEPVWLSITKKPWGSLPMVQDQSAYVSVFNQIFKEIIPILANKIEEQKLFKTFCDKLAESIPGKLLQVIMKSKPISDVGAEQLLLDVHGIKEGFLKNISVQGSANQPASTFYKVLAKSFAKIEILLKVLLTPSVPPEALVDSFLKVYPPEECRRSSFMTILELKGLRKNETTQLMERFLALRPAVAALSPTADPSGQNDKSFFMRSNSTAAAATQMRKIFSFSSTNHPQ